MTVTLIAAAFVALVASPALVALLPKRAPAEKRASRASGQSSRFSAGTTANRG
jgi:hypothetical protein